MGSMNRLVAAITVAVLSLSFAGAAHAHVGITDETGQVAAVLHFEPDDTVTAGKETIISFDVKTQAMLPTFSQAVLTVINKADSSTEPVAVKVDGSIVSGKFTFKKAGAYNLRLILASGETSFTFRHDQIVGGTTEVAKKEPTQSQSQAMWAIGTLLVAIAGVASVSIVALRRRPKAKL